MVGDDDGEVPPVPIPNTEVKLTVIDTDRLFFSEDVPSKLNIELL